MKQITIFGATGKTGKLVVAQALERGFEVVAFTRDRSKLDLLDARLRLVQGDISDAQAVERAVSGSDAVISVLGPASNRPEFAVSRGTQNILTAMQKQNVKRLVLSTGAGVGDAGDQPKAFDKIIVALLRVLNKNVLEDMVRTVDLVRASDRDWTIVRVPMLTDDPATGRIRAGAVGKDIGTRIGRADMAAFILRQLEDDTYMSQAPSISN